MDETVLSFIAQNRMLRAGDTVTVALSGGADSTALLYFLRRNRDRLGIRLTAAHFHHGLRREEADRDREYVKDLCAKLDIALALGAGDVRREAERTGESLEEAARRLRYDFLRSAAPGKLATAHHLDDNAETLLLHLLRGTGPRGLGGIPPVRGNIIRPFLCLTRDEILADLEARGISWVEDSTNEADDCLRNRLRHGVIPLLRAENPSFARTVGRGCALVRQEDAYLSALAEEAGREARRADGWSCEALRRLDPVLLRRVILGRLRELGLENPSYGDVAAIQRLIFSPDPSAGWSLPGGWQVRREYDLLRLAENRPQTTWEELPLRIPGVTILPGDLGEIRCDVTKNSKIRHKNPFTFALKYDMIAESVCSVRPRQVKDALRLSGGTKTLKKLMIDRRIPRARRDQIPILAVDGRAVAALGLAADRDCLAGPEELALVVEYRPGAAGIPVPWGGHEGEDH